MVNLKQGLVRLDDSTKKNFLIKSTDIRKLKVKGITSMFSLKYVKRGEEVYTIDGLEYRVPSNNFILTNPEQEIDIDFESEVGSDGACFFFDTELVRQISFSLSRPAMANLDEAGVDDKFILERNCLNNIYNIPVNSFQTRLHSLLGSLEYEELDDHEITDLLVCLSEGLVQHQFDTSKNFLRLTPATQSTRVEQYRRLQVAKQYMHDNLSRNISLKDIAQAALLSEYYFHRSFKKYFGVTPQKYLQNIRLQKAEEYLLADYSKSDVAHMCGFQEPKYFSRVFKKWKQQQLK